MTRWTWTEGYALDSSIEFELAPGDWRRGGVLNRSHFVLVVLYAGQRYVIGEPEKVRKPATRG